jgi:DNA-binding NtrC family response regulator
MRCRLGDSGMLVRLFLAITDPILRGRVEAMLANPHIHLVTLADREDAIARLGSESYDIGIVDGLPAPAAAQGLLEQIQRLPDRPAILLLTESDQASVDMQCGPWLTAGVLAVLDASVDEDSLASTLDAFIARRRQDRLDRLGAARRGRALQTTLVSTSTAMTTVLDTARRVAMSDSSVLVLGETGVGKERLALLLHTSGPRCAGPFVAINCAAIPGDLFESELFGHHRGAFTGAIRARRGKFELAHGGTIFLDEVGEVPLHLQAKLLRVLQEGHVTPVGSDASVEVDVRVIASTNRDLRVELEAGRFRRDLFYRLGVVELTIPPLRERRVDIPGLAQTYLRGFREQLGREVGSLSAEAMQALCRYDWPGNVRELVNVIERAVLLTRREEITLEDLPDSVAACATVAPSESENDERSEVCVSPGTVSISSTLLDHPWKVVREAIVREGERAYLEALLREHQGRIAATARRAGISARALFEKMRKHGLRKEDYRDVSSSRMGSHSSEVSEPMRTEVGIPIDRNRKI